MAVRIDHVTELAAAVADEDAGAVQDEPARVAA
jgi:hypothetical protein